MFMWILPGKLPTDGGAVLTECGTSALAGDSLYLREAAW